MNITPTIIIKYINTNNKNSNNPIIILPVSVKLYLIFRFQMFIYNLFQLLMKLMNIVV